jgi:hypothetical protein
MTISRIQAALGMVKNEVTVAAAQINFDFTLVKNEAPKEYHLLGECLSKRRKDEAKPDRFTEPLDDWEPCSRECARQRRIS